MKQIMSKGKGNRGGRGQKGKLSKASASVNEASTLNVPTVRR